MKIKYNNYKNNNNIISSVEIIINQKLLKVKDLDFVINYSKKHIICIIKKFFILIFYLELVKLENQNLIKLYKCTF